MSMYQNTEMEYDSKLDITDLVLIELMKSDENFSEHVAPVDMNLSPALKRKYRKDSKTWLARLIAERAAKYCENKQNVDTQALRSKIKSWLYSCLFISITIVALVALLHASGTTRWMFSPDRNEASIGCLIWLLIVPPVFCILPFVTCLTLLVRSRRLDNDHPESRLSKLARQFSIPGLIRGGWQVWHDLAGSDRSSVARSLERFADRKGHIATISFLTISNAFMFFLSVAVFLAILQFLMFNKVNYSWTSSLMTTKSKVATIRFIGRLVPFVSPPSKGAVEWAFAGELPASSPAIPNMTIHLNGEELNLSRSDSIAGGEVPTDDSDAGVLPQMDVEL